MYSRRSEFRAEFHKVVNHMLTADEYEQAWRMLIEKYNLKSHVYMTQIYEIRQKCADADPRAWTHSLRRRTR